MKQCLFAIAFVLTSFCAFSQSTIIQGVVIDSISREAIPYVKVRLTNGAAGGLTDNEGIYFIQTQSKVDSVEFSFVGYKSQKFAITQGITNEINVSLMADIKSFDVIDIVAGENPAFEILRRIKANKKANNPANLDSYECEVYNKMQFDVNKLGKKFEDRKVFSGMDLINDYVDVDSSTHSKYLPILLTESISDYYFKSDPRQVKEVMKANRITGVDYLQLQQFTGDLHQSVNVYDNYIELFNKEFMSPIADGGRAFYKYYLQQPDTIDKQICYHLEFVPKRKGDAVFVGEMWIADSSFAVKKMQARIPNNVNLNYVSALEVDQDYNEVEPGHWMITKEEVKAHFDLFNDKKKKKLQGATVHKKTTREKFKINETRDFDFYVTDLEMNDSAKVRDDAYWDSHRHDKLTEEEQGVIDMVDSLKDNRLFKFYENATYMAYSGFWRGSGPLEVGSIYSLYTRNQTEGHRVMLALRTSNRFSTKVEMNGFWIYGFGDQDLKSGGSLRWKIRNAPREMMRFAYRRRIEILGLDASIGDIGNSFTTLFSLAPQDKLTMVQKGEWSFEKDWRFDMRTFNSVEWKRFEPLGFSDYSRYNTNTGDTNRVASVTSFEIRNQIMFTKEEKFLNGQFDRTSLGSKFPIVSLTHTWGIKGVLGSEYDFHRLDFVWDHRPRVGMFGRIQYSIYAGKIFGSVPYPFLQIHPGNETFFLQRTGFNLMTYYEFISDEWVGVNFEHRLQGFIMDRIPLIKKLKLRMVYSAKMVVGKYNNKHNAELILPAYSNRLQQPYYEVGVGLENIFKFIRIDAVWRLSYRDHVNSLGNPVRNFGVMFMFTSDF